MGLIEAGRGAAPRRVVEVVRDEELRHAETLLPAIDQCLAEASCELSAVDGVAVSLGPGSFTGLRVGLATAKGLALATEAWLIGVPTLEAYAEAASSRWSAQEDPLRDGDYLYVCLDARKAEVYGALFRFDTDGAQSRLVSVLEDAVETPERARERVQATLQQRGAGESSLRFVGEGVQRYRDEFRSPLEEFLYSTEILEGPEARGFAVAEVGLERFGQQGPADPIYLAPVYLRESEAERKRRQNS